MADVRLAALQKSFGPVRAVASLTLSIRDGEFLVLVGPSGCGKTTVLRIVAGLEYPDEGTVEIGGRDVTDDLPRERDIAMVFQNYALYPHMNVFENMAFALRRRRIPREEIEGRIRRTADMMEIGDLLDRKPRQLSGGQRQRVAVCRAIVREPSVFLFDEPLSNLDAQLRVLARWEIKKLLHRLRTTAIYVTHDQVEAMTMGDRIAVMREGRLQQLGAPIELYERPANRFVASFIGSPAMNMFGGAVAREGGRRLLKALGRSFLLPSEGPATGAVEVGVRPEHISLAPAEGVEAARVHGQVELVESLGSEVILRVAAAGARLTVKCPGTLQTGIGESVELHIDTRRVHLFDPEKGDRFEG
jgi:multiple sugar transport system ATP-binding protein